MSDHHPLNFEALKKGDVIPREQIEKIYSVSFIKTPDKFRLCAMQLSSQIEAERNDLLTRIDGASIRIMEDLEADQVTYRRGEKAVASLLRNTKRRAVIDRDDFTDDQKRVAEFRDRTMTAIALVTRKELDKARREELLLAAGNGDTEAAE